MKTIKVLGRPLRDENFLIKSARDEDTGLEINTPSTLLNLLRLRKELRHTQGFGFEYTFPFAFDPFLHTNGFKADFPLIFE